MYATVWIKWDEAQGRGLAYPVGKALGFTLLTGGGKGRGGGGGEEKEGRRRRGGRGGGEEEEEEEEEAAATDVNMWNLLASPHAHTYEHMPGPVLK